jgi:uncharacterized protein (TIGR02599 family)
LHFLSGHAIDLVPGADAVNNPGQAVFFQVPMGNTDDHALGSLNRTLNATGFYIQYGSLDANLLPDWLKPLFGTTKRFRLVQVVEPTENLQVYSSTTSGAKAGYDLDWLGNFKTPPTTSQPRARVLAEDIPLLVIRPRLAPEDERAVAATLGETFSDATQGSILSPNYHYDSRAWEAGYPASLRVKAAAAPAARAEAMRNQIPPIVDLAMVSVDRRSLARFDQTSATPPKELQIPAGLFTNSSHFEEDLAAYGKQLSDAKIRYRVFRTSVEIQGAKWSNN